MVRSYRLQYEQRGDRRSIKELVYKLFYWILTYINRERSVIAIQSDLRSEQIDKQAVRLMDSYANSVLRLAYSYLHNMSDAEDVLQEALIQFLRAQPKLESSDHEKAWFLRVAINLSKNKLTYNKTRKTDELSDTLAVAETEDLAFVWDAVKHLPPKYREVVHLYYHEGYSTAQIALLLSKNEATVRSQLQRARAKLKKVLREVYDFEESV